MKKRFILLTLTLLIFAFILGLSSAFAASASVSVSGGGAYEVGKTVNITFTLSGTNIAQATTEIRYDSSVLQYTGGSGATLPSSASVDPAQAPNNMMMHINVQSTGTQVI